MNRKHLLPETHWNTLGKSTDPTQGARKIGEPLPVIRTYEYQGKTVKVYASASSPDLQSENRTTVNPSAGRLQIVYPAS